MNARQKAKKYKKELERLKYEIFRPTFIKETNNISTIKSQYVVSRKDLPTEPPEEVIYKELLRQITKSDIFKHHVKYEVLYDKDKDEYVHTATVKVIN